MRCCEAIYTAVLFFAPNGSFLGKHRKIMPTGSERLAWGFGDGSTIPVFPEAVVTRGGSCIVDPFGNFLAGPNMEDEVTLTAEVDRGQIIRGKYDLDVVGHYARPDIFQLHVDERPKRPVTTHASDTAGEEKRSLHTSRRAAPRAGK